MESGGGANVDSHLMVNNGDGTFAVDSSSNHQRLEAESLPPLNVYGRFHMGHFADLDNDGDLDLVLGQIRDADRVTQFSIVLVNDGTGHYGDGLRDLLLTHTRNSLDGGWTGRYVQVLSNRGGAAFADETAARMGDQSATTPGHKADGGDNQNLAEAEMYDVDRDGCADLVMSHSRGPLDVEAPLVYRNDGSGRFRAMPPEPFAGSDGDFGYFAVPVHADDDQVIDFVVPRRGIVKCCGSALT